MENRRSSASASCSLPTSPCCWRPPTFPGRSLNRQGSPPSNALVRSYPAADISWCVLLTDGVEEPASHLDITVEHIAVKDEAGLREVLAQIHRWEADTDPNGKHLPRFKRHDDKTIAVVRFA